MSKMYRVTSFKLLGDYILQIQFNDDSSQTIDFEPILTGPIFGPLHHPEMFQLVSLDPVFGALEWPNGADINPGVLHDWDNHLDTIITHRKQFLAESC